MTQECVGQEKTRNGDDWRQNVAKRKRNSGEAYVSRTTGRQVPARTVGPPCRDGCWDKITMPIVTEINRILGNSRFRTSECLATSRSAYERRKLKGAVKFRTPRQRDVALRLMSTPLRMEI